MGLLDWWFRPKQKAFLEGPRRFKVAVVGESHYQGNLEAICGSRSYDGENRIVEACLVLEDSNPFDDQAVRVDIEGRPVGHLNREMARQYRAKLTEAGFAGVDAYCNARIRGGWDRGGGDRGSYGVWLDLPVEQE